MKFYCNPTGTLYPVRPGSPAAGVRLAGPLALPWQDGTTETIPAAIGGTDTRARALTGLYAVDGAAHTWLIVAYVGCAARSDYPLLLIAQSDIGNLDTLLAAAPIGVSGPKWAITHRLYADGIRLERQ